MIVPLRKTKKSKKSTRVSSKYTTSVYFLSDRYNYRIYRRVTLKRHSRVPALIIATTIKTRASCFLYLFNFA